MIDKDVAELLMGLTDQVTLKGADPDLVKNADLMVRARAQLRAVIDGGGS